MLPPGRRNGYWESYKSEIAAYELDKLLEMNMVPPAVERTIDVDKGAAIMWVTGPKSVKQLGGRMPAGPEWGRVTRKMLTFDAFIGNGDRNAGNILVGPPGELLLIDHSRAFVEDTKLPRKIERVDAGLWTRIEALSREQMARALGPWLDDRAIDALIARRQNMSEQIDEQIKKKKDRTLVVIE